MTPDEPPVIAPLTAVWLLLALLALGVGVALAVSFASNRFQRMQDKRFASPPSRTEWLRVNLAIWVRDVVDGIRRVF